MLRALRTVAVLLAGLALAGAGPVGWGGDINAGEGDKLVEQARPLLAGIVNAVPAERPALIQEFSKEHGLRLIEAVKRFRNPELHPLFVALLEHDDWKVRHRALLALEHYGDTDDLPLAFALLDHAERRLREKAAITCIKLWDAARGKAAAGGDPAKWVAARRAAEPDPHVRACLDALLRRIANKLPVQRVYTEHLETLGDGLALTPFLSGMDTVKLVAPNYTKAGVSQGGGGSGDKEGGADMWTTPLLGYGEEEVTGTSLQPFANLRGNGTVYHTGQDVGSCLDGAGYYAAARGVVKLVHSGSDMGTLIVVQHATAKKELVNAVYMHGGDTVFVKAGESVDAGQLLGSMGMSYSIENGGHFAHLHFGLYPGAYSDTHNYGYKPVKAGLADWLDPAEFLPRWMRRTAPFVDGSTSADPAGTIDRVVARAMAEREDGFPSWAVRILVDAGKACRDMPGAERIEATLTEWRSYPAFERDLEAEKAFDAAEVRAAKLADKKGGAETVRTLWKDLLTKYGDTGLRARIEARLR